MKILKTKLILDQLNYIAQKNSPDWCVENHISSLERIVSEYGHIGAIFYLNDHLDKENFWVDLNLTARHREILLEMLK